MGLSRRATVSHLRVIPVTTGIVAEKQGTRADVATRFRAGQSGNPKGRPSRKVAARRSTACAESYRSIYRDRRFDTPEGRRHRVGSPQSVR